ncbi:pyruvate phosphate dikinase PEP/pyruvate-binding protein [Desulfovibrio sp. X2]|uniref:PEP/pyruvate-binding domain-containing protein n=1 Tax=Desulfovibrio sp. X2 TaxID=941449 RepID=UPI0003586FF1|nr:PEP/pyruvate-binding domain-containing protein [Desulfovibrio sp. X2]EPR43167.1 pyruvate phosphate dikinase PEP/pyruvate-binding protein [Desulfovibrio sp. X2]
MPRFLDFFRRKAAAGPHDGEPGPLERKYGLFKSLLAGNNQALELMTDLERLVYEGRSFVLDDALALAETLMGAVYDIVEDLNALGGGRWPGLFDRAESIGVSALQALTRHRSFSSPDLVLPLVQLSLEQLGEVGGKAANLGEVGNRVGLPTPRGFAVTASAAAAFLRAGGLGEGVHRLLAGVDIADTEALEAACAEAGRRITAAPLPAELSAALDAAGADMARTFGPDVRLAVRSSAACEDSEASFAGQHATVLGVAPGGLSRAWREVVASAWTPRAVFYRRSKGYSDQDVMMSVLVLTMIDARASGVLYTADPNAAQGGGRGDTESRADDVLVSAAFGLGLGVVDGSQPSDFWRVRRASRAVAVEEIAHKDTALRLASAGGSNDQGIVGQAVPDAQAGLPALSRAQVATLADYALRLEEHYGAPLDVEWAMDGDGRMYVLQARPLARAQRAVEAEACAYLPGRVPLLSGGQSASPGTAAGPAYVVRADHHLHDVPPGAILVARQTSPAYVAFMGRVAGIVTDVGSVTGHMASVAREFGIPTLVGTGQATALVRHGEEVTLDASGRVVYAGRVEALLSERRPVNLMKGSPVYKAVQEALSHIAPLNLVDPEREDFSPDSCRTLHDIIRFAHEMAMREMFDIAEELAEGDEPQGRGAVPLFTGLPMRVLVVDLGGGLAPRKDKRLAQVDEVLSVPFAAMLKGMRHPDVRWHGTPGVNLAGFASIVAESVFRDPVQEGRMGEANYAVISAEYMNFNGRLGYHFATVDAYCGPAINDNYVTFSFKGGAADVGRRTRRAALIGALLLRLGFKVAQRGDWIKAEMKKYDAAQLCAKLDQLGRLLGSVRLLDMVLADDAQIDWYVEEFFKGNYAFERPPLERTGG